ncbi:MAG: hypothetical protein DI598_17515 [Pseudopedobacter saltans]|uniref:Uncharacterized protein n=1 Tax=Pseudopedobacter saltans TaxID=151895 RepID=A0A2W5ECC5_9SPHI|nr:MAG: hypothetical protein DI598_17515 [Pseudopedobacter saltans]
MVKTPTTARELQTACLKGVSVQINTSKMKKLLHTLALVFVFNCVFGQANILLKKKESQIVKKVDFTIFNILVEPLVRNGIKDSGIFISYGLHVGKNLKVDSVITINSLIDKNVKKSINDTVLKITEQIVFPIENRDRIIFRKLIIYICKFDASENRITDYYNLRLGESDIFEINKLEQSTNTIILPLKSMMYPIYPMVR